MKGRIMKTEKRGQEKAGGWRMHSNSIRLACRWLGVTAIMALLCLAGCGIFEDKAPVKIQEESLKKLGTNAFPVFSDHMEFSGFHQALAQSLSYYKKVPGSRMFAFGPDQYPATHMILSLETLQAFLNTNPSVSDLNRFIRDHFHVYASTANANGQVLFTGYFEPTFPGSPEPDARFQIPLYSLPNDLVEIDLARFSDQYKGHDKLKGRVDKKQVVPYFSRQEINHNAAFHEQAPPVAWLENRVDRFFLEIQGSGRIQTPDQEILRIHYAGANGKPYRSIGRYLIENGEIAKEDMSMQAIRKWLEDNPLRMDEVLHHNESVVFFKIGTDGPFGNIGVTLTPLRSMATDYRIFPAGAICFIETRLPDPTADPGGEPDQWQPVSLFVMNQDTGGAIRGPARADLFCGSDDYARFTAGHMNVRGKVYFLVMK
jgi:membrane-bound lytic murein transglycosylase A